MLGLSFELYFGPRQIGFVVSSLRLNCSTPVQDKMLKSGLYFLRAQSLFRFNNNSKLSEKLYLGNAANYQQKKLLNVHLKLMNNQSSASQE